MLLLTRYKRNSENSLYIHIQIKQWVEKVMKYLYRCKKLMVILLIQLQELYMIDMELLVSKIFFGIIFIRS